MVWPIALKRLLPENLSVNLADSINFYCLKNKALNALKKRVKIKGSLYFKVAVVSIEYITTQESLTNVDGSFHYLYLSEFNIWISEFTPIVSSYPKCLKFLRLSQITPHDSMYWFNFQGQRITSDENGSIHLRKNDTGTNYRRVALDVSTKAIIWTIFLCLHTSEHICTYEMRHNCTNVNKLFYSLNFCILMLSNIYIYIIEIWTSIHNYVHMCLHMYTYVLTYVHKCIYICVYICTHMYTCIYMYIYVFTYVFPYVHICIYICVYMSP